LGPDYGDCRTLQTWKEGRRTEAPIQSLKDLSSKVSGRSGQGGELGESCGPRCYGGAGLDALEAGLLTFSDSGLASWESWSRGWVGGRHRPQCGVGPGFLGFCCAARPHHSHRKSLGVKHCEINNEYGQEKITRKCSAGSGLLTGLLAWLWALPVSPNYHLCLCMLP
jgi:hypothetical protein